MTRYRSIFKNFRQEMAGLCAALFLFMAANVSAGQATLAWNPNTESDLAGYKLHYGTTSGNYTNHVDVHNVTTYTVTGLTEGQTYYFAASAYDSSGYESGYSSSVAYAVPGPTSNTSGSTAPPAPVLISPIDDAVTGTTPTLKTAAYSAGTTTIKHGQTRWQVFREEDQECLLNILSATALTSVTVPKLVLEEGTPYFWRVRFLSANGSVSTAWSDIEYFSTGTTGTDSNANGIPDALEVGRSVDLDRDRVADYRQPTIKSLKVTGTSYQVGVSIKGSSNVIGIEAVETEKASATGTSLKLPFGLIDFRIAVAGPGTSTSVRVYLSQAAPAGSKWYRYDPLQRTWVDFSSKAVFSSDRRSVALSLTDGGQEDVDGRSNGVLVIAGGVVAP